MAGRRVEQGDESIRTAFVAVGIWVGAEKEGEEGLADAGEAAVVGEVGRAELLPPTASDRGEEEVLVVGHPKQSIGR